MITAAMLQLLQDAGTDVLVLVETIDEDEFRRSRLTRSETQRLLKLMADTLDELPDVVRTTMPEIDWEGWRAIGAAMEPPAANSVDTAWFAARSLVPATLSWLRVYKQSQPALFAFRA